MTATMSELSPDSRSRSERERFVNILAAQRAAYRREGAPSLTKRRSDLKKFKAAMLARRGAMGAYHGVEGFRTLSHAKGIFEQGRWNFIELLRAPFGSRADALLKFFLR